MIFHTPCVVSTYYSPNYRYEVDLLTHLYIDLLAENVLQRDGLGQARDAGSDDGYCQGGHDDGIFQAYLWVGGIIALICISEDQARHAA